MNKKIFVKLLLTALAVGSVTATETRTPLPGLQGPLRYEFEKLEKNKWGFNFWSTAYQREADKAFMKHGTNTEPYTALLFGKSKFKIAEAFQDGVDSPHYTKNSNPYLGTADVAPRASYTERGMVVGASLVYPVWKNDGHIGLRASLPLRSVRIEKDDEMEHAAAGVQDKVIKNEVRYITATHNALRGAGGGAVNKVISNISSYNLKFLASVKTLDSDGTVKGLFNVNAGNTAPKVGGVPFGSANATVGVTGDNTHNIPFIVIKTADASTAPFGYGGALLHDHNGDTFQDVESGTTRVCYVDADGSTVRLQTTGGGAMTAIGNDFADAGTPTHYTLTSDVNTYPISKIPETLWLTTIHGNSGGPIGTSGTAVGFIDSALNFYNQDVTSFLTAKGYTFQTYQQTGIGDADLDLFYQHSLSDNWTGEIYTGVRLPTGAANKYEGNPYKMNLGNGGHFEVKVGGKLGWAMFKNIDVKADASYSFVLQAKEHRMAAFKDATIKNIGPKADADVDWGYFKGDFDVTLYHPKTHDLSTTLGYELYYKTEDKVSFKNATTSDHFLGQVWAQNGVSTPATATVAGNHWADLPWTLSNAAARKNTESIAHRGYVEGHYDFSKYLSMYAGGKYTFAGQNIPRESEAYGGLNVKF